METVRVERLLKLIQALQAGRPHTIEELAEFLDVSRRTVFRDLDLVTRAGIPYSVDRATGRYSTDSSALLPPLSLTHAEGLALMLASRYLLLDYAPDQEAAAAAGMKIESVLPAPIRDFCGSLLRRIEVRAAPASDSASIAGVFATLQAALAKPSKIHVGYDSLYEDRVIETVLHPYRLAFIHRGWYLIAHSELHEEVRTFKVERILRSKVLDEKFAMSRRFSLDDYFGHAWNMIRGEERYYVKIRFHKTVAANVDEIRWHKTQRTTYEPDGSLLFEVDVDGVGEIAWWVLGYGEHAQVIEPPKLREIMLRHAERMHTYYRPNGRGGAGSGGK